MGHVQIQRPASSTARSADKPGVGASTGALKHSHPMYIARRDRDSGVRAAPMLGIDGPESRTSLESIRRSCGHVRFEAQAASIGHLEKPRARSTSMIDIAGKQRATW